MDKKWYIVNTQTGCEQTAKTAILERVKSQKMEQHFGDILIPAENVVELVKGQKKERSRKFFPGYIFVNMFLSDETWHLVKHSSKVSGFVGGGLKTRPPEVPEHEVLRVTQQMQGLSEKPRAKVKFAVGENVTVVDGPLAISMELLKTSMKKKPKLKFWLAFLDDLLLWS